METVRFAFYKPQKGDWFGHLISGWTKIFNWGSPQYCHVEIGFFIAEKWVWYSSSSRNDDGTSGTRWITNDNLFKHPERWDVFEVKAIRPISSMIDTANVECGKPYDWSGIAGFITLTGNVNEQ